MTSALLAALLLAQPASERVLVIHTPTGITQRQARLYDAHLKLELLKHDGLAIASGPPSQTDEQACVREPTCLAQLAKVTGAEVVVFARTARLDSDSVVTLKRLRIDSGEIEQIATRQLTGGDGQEMLSAIGPMVSEIFPDEPLRTGVSQGVPANEVVRWNPPPVQPWMFLVSAGATVIAGSSILVFAAQKHDAESDFKHDSTSPTGAPVSGAQLAHDMDRAQSATTHANIAIAVTAGLAVTTAILAYFTDWHQGADKPFLIGPTGVQGTF